MAMTAAGIPTDGRGNRLSAMGEIVPISEDEKKRWSSVSDIDKHGAYLAGLGLAESQTQRPVYASHAQQAPQTYNHKGQTQGLPVNVKMDEEEQLDDQLTLARRNSMDHAALKRAS
jgi:hypothetical protein